MSEALYLACYVIKTEAENVSFGSFAAEPAPQIEKSPYFTDEGNYLSWETLHKYVVRWEKPRIAVLLGAIPSASVDSQKLLDETLASLNFSVDERARWCLINEKEKRHGAVLFYLVHERDFADKERKIILSQSYSKDEFYPRFFEDFIRPFNLHPRYIPPRHRDPFPGHSTKRTIRLGPVLDETISQSPEEIRRTITHDEIVEYLAQIEELTHEPDGGDDGKRFFRYEVTAPLAIYRFLAHLQREVSLGIPDEATLAGRSVRMWEIEQEAAKHWPPEGGNEQYWITRQKLVDLGHVRSMNTARTYANNSDRYIYRASDGLSGWDHDNRYWRSSSDKGNVFYYVLTKEGLQESES